MKKIILIINLFAVTISSNGQSLSYGEFMNSSDTQQKVIEKKKNTYTTSQSRSFVADVSIQGLLGWEELGYNYYYSYYLTTISPSISANIGIELLIFYLGLGVEFMPNFPLSNSYYTYPNMHTSYAFQNSSIPLYFTWRTYIRSSQTCQPYFWCDLGGIIGINYGKDGVLLRCGFAVDYKRINIGLFANMNALGKNTEIMLGFGAKVGYRFGNLTY